MAEAEKNKNQPESTSPSHILDTIMGTQAQNSLSSFEPGLIVTRSLLLLKERDREILNKRFGLDGNEIETLETIGKKYTLTRERVRQIERDSVLVLKKKKLPELVKSLEVIFDTIHEHGDIMSEEMLMLALLMNKPGLKEKRAVQFLLYFGDQFKFLKENSKIWPSWIVIGFDEARFGEILNELVEILKKEGRTLRQEELMDKFRQTEFFASHKMELTEKILSGHLGASKQILTNPFGEVGLSDWSEIKPRDVGDKAYLVLKHHGKPEHYSVITDLINQQKFDGKTAYMETVHNELIKDSRFVLVGRGIYALSEWGFKKGVVADVIKEILAKANQPMERDRIIEEVMKNRQVKRNTILVGLSNKKYFQKVGKNKYTLAGATETNTQ